LVQQGEVMALPSAYGEESPEALRRRADVLLDEMMLGGVDTASAGPHTGNGAAHWPSAGEVGLEYDGASYGGNAPNGVHEAGSFDAHAANGYAPPPAPAAPPIPAPKSVPSSASSSPAPASGGRLISAQERYAPFMDAQPASPTPATTDPWRAAEPVPQPSTPASTTNTNSGPALPAADELSGAGDGWQPGGAAVRRQSPSFASTMSVGVRAANRSNLLPRNNEIDATAAQQEINELLRAVATGLPAGNEAVERSRHLLNKAQTLLQSDPTRTAEVDYYLQQVRRTVQRTRQTQQWSSLYRQRLTVYLWAWLLLSALSLAAAALYAAPLADWLNQVIDAPDWWLIIQQTPVLLAGAFAGSLGASLSALLHMQRQGRREFGYFDRKYGLRGLLLPPLGLFLGLLLAGVWSGVYLIVGIDPVLYLWAIAAPAALALLVGFAQQWLYGAR
jgi:hypothetical protein